MEFYCIKGGNHSRLRTDGWSVNSHLVQTKWFEILLNLSNGPVEKFGKLLIKILDFDYFFWVIVYDFVSRKKREKVKYQFCRGRTFSLMSILAIDSVNLGLSILTKVSVNYLMIFNLYVDSVATSCLRSKSLAIQNRTVIRHDCHKIRDCINEYFKNF